MRSTGSKLYLISFKIELAWSRTLGRRSMSLLKRAVVTVPSLGLHCLLNWDWECNDINKESAAMDTLWCVSARWESPRSTNTSMIELPRVSHAETARSRRWFINTSTTKDWINYFSICTIKCHKPKACNRVLHEASSVIARRLSLEKMKTSLASDVVTAKYIN